MKTVIARLDNKRIFFPPLDMSHVMRETDTSKLGKYKLENTNEWFPTVNKECKKLIICGTFENLVSIIRVRGVVHLLAGHHIEEVNISGVRCPIHFVKNVGKMGNKDVIDIVFATDPSGLKIENDNILSCDIKFPHGFSPICYISKSCEHEYLSAVFHDVGVLAIDISPISFRLLWNIPGQCTVKIQQEGESEPLILKDHVNKLEIENMDPSTKYDIVIFGNDDVYKLRVVTPDISHNEMAKYYRSKRQENGVFDLSQVRSDHIAYLRSEGIMKSGDRVLIKGEWEKSSSKYHANVVHSGDTCPLDGECTVYVIPDFSTDDEQYVCINSVTNHFIQFDKTESYVKYMDTVYKHDSSFRVGNHMVSVVKGSIILVLVQHDDPIEFPGGEDAASQVLSSGDLVVKDIVMRSSSHVNNKVVGGVTYGLSSFYVYDSSNSSTTECSRISHKVDDALEQGSVDVSVLYTDAALSQSMFTTISSSASKTVFSCKDETSELNATIGSDGLSFDTDLGDIYFGGNKEFRIHYAPAASLDPAMLQIQRLSSGEYVTSMLVTAEPP